MNLKRIFSVNTAKQVASLGAGSVAARYVTSDEVAGKLLKTEKAMQFADAIPIVGGAVLSQQKNGLLKGLGFGMIAHSAGNVIAKMIDKDGSLGINGGDVMMNGGDIFMNGYAETAETASTADGPAPSFSTNASNEMAY